MDWNAILGNALEVILVAAIGVATTYLTAWLKAKKQELLEKTKSETLAKYIDMLDKTVYECVIATNQTFVDALKAEGAFDAEAQKKAFQLTFEAVKAVITEDAESYLTEAVKDLDAFISNKIEAQVNLSK